MPMQTIRERGEEIKLLMEYAVPLEHRPQALALLTLYENDPVALNLLHSFYSYLPEAREDGIRELRLLNRKKGVFLLGALTFSTAYLYLATSEGAEFLGEHGEGIWDEEALAFFEFKSREAFLAAHGDLAGFPVYEPAHRDQALCPICAAAAGEEHILGCPVEVCPWCAGQLTRCNCRFDQVERNELREDQEVESFEERLKRQGRIPYDPTIQRPGFPAAEEEEEDEEDEDEDE